MEANVFRESHSHNVVISKMPNDTTLPKKAGLLAKEDQDSHGSVGSKSQRRVGSGPGYYTVMAQTLIRMVT